jgi:hypothetical protein
LGIEVIKMYQSIFYTESKIGKGYDIIHLYHKPYARKMYYTLYLNYKDWNVDLGFFDELPPKYLTRQELDEMQNGYKLDESYDLTGYDPRNYERFHRDTPNSEDDVDLVVIHRNKKEYTASYGVDSSHTDGYDVIGNPIYSTYVGEKMFNIIMAGLRVKGYKEVKQFEDEV